MSTRVETWINETSAAVGRLERLAKGESTTPAQIAEQSQFIKDCMEKLQSFNSDEISAYQNALSTLRTQLDVAMKKLHDYQSTVKEQIQTNAIRAKANKQYGGGK